MVKCEKCRKEINKSFQGWRYVNDELTLINDFFNN